jgi:HAE1 family hydrophobic/amphiphilic exporter-1
MSTLTSVGGMLPLVLMPGAGSELYRGIGSVVVGGLLVSTVFTILLVPLLMNVLLPRRFARLAESAGAA